MTGDIDMKAVGAQPDSAGAVETVRHTNAIDQRLDEGQLAGEGIEAEGRNRVIHQAGNVDVIAADRRSGAVGIGRNSH